MQIDIKDLANISKSIIKDPKKNINKIKKILNIKTQDENETALIYISILKVFKNIIPLYKIRTLKDKVKHKKDDLEINEEDKILLKTYSFFINKICSDTSYTTYSIAAEILDHFEHFNFIDIIVKKVLKGTQKEENISRLCLNTIKKKINEDINGDVIFCIVNQMYETSFHFEVLSFLLEIKFLHNFLEEESEKSKDKFFKVKRSFKKEERKLEKNRRKIEEERRKEENLEVKQDGFVIHRKIVDSLQRLYFLILREKVKQKFKFTFIGIRKYKEFVRKEFYEGLYILLNDSLNLCNYEEKLYCILTILDIYESYRYDFKKLVQALFCILNPFNKNLNINKMLLIEQVIEHLFIKIKQPIIRVHLILERLILFGSLRYNPIVKRIVTKVSSFYDIDFTDRFKYKEIYYLEEDLEEKDIDHLEIKPLYCFELLKKIL